MNVLSVFTGVGGIDLGLERAGHRIVGQCEADPWRRAILAHHWPDTHIATSVQAVRYLAERGRWPDGSYLHEGPTGARPRRLRTVGGDAGRADAGRSRACGTYSDGGIDGICGGFPCQDVSSAGLRAGLAGSRSGLWWEYLRIIDAIRPGWVLIENVPGLLTSNGGRDFGAVIGSLADVGYCLAWRVVDSRFFGVPQRRRRVFILGTRVGDDPDGARARAGAVLAVGESCRRHPPQGREKGPRVAVVSALGTSNGGRGGWRVGAEEAAGNQVIVAFHSKAAGSKRTRVVRSGGVAGTAFRGGAEAVLHGARVRRLTPVECERLQGFPDDWTLIPNAKSPDSRRYAAMGDAVTVTVAEWIGQRLKAAGT